MTDETPAQPSDGDDAVTQEHARLQAQNLELATLAGGLAHEIRNPLSTMRMNLELLSEDLEDEGTPGTRRMQTRVDKLKHECLNLEGVLNAFLQFARAGQLNLVTCSLNDEVHDFLSFIRPQAEDTGVELRPHLDANLPAVAIDTALIRQVLSNLGRNALQAMPDGGTLEFITRSRENHVTLEVIDTGEGMTSATVEKMFQAFFSTRSGGSGLGLPTVRRIIEAHGGSIECESEPGRGTRFTILIPVS
ncbi:MAG TPA: two-component sensor histidine kinase [Planctomycetaceae bacterium]|nr:two-component sensor histidine kinase [Planctomycetaceae bacterium]